MPVPEDVDGQNEGRGAGRGEGAQRSPGGDDGAFEPSPPLVVVNPEGLDDDGLSVATPKPPAHRAGIKSGRLAGLSVQRAVVVMAVPVLIESLLSSMVGAVDAIMAARVSVAAADAVGGAVYLLWGVGLISAAIGVGATALISRAVGAGRLAAARAALGQAMLLAIVGGVSAAVLLAWAAPVLARVQSLTGEGEADFINYIRAYCLGLPFSTMMFAANACARGAGDTVRPAFVMVVVNIVNLVLVYVMAIVLDMGVLGIGLGTSLAHAVGCGIAVWFMRNGVSGVRLDGRRMAFHGVTMFRLLRLGLPNFAEMFGMWVANYLIILMVGVMNAAAEARNAAIHGAVAASESAGLLGAHLLAIRIEAFSFIFGFGLGIAASALTGQYLGAGAPMMARRAALLCAGAAALAMGTLGVVLIFAGTWLVSLLSGQPAHAELAPPLLMITGFVQVPFAYAIVLRSALHGAGDVRAVMVLTWICQWGLRLPLCYLLSGVDLPLPEVFGGGVLENPSPVDWGLTGLWTGLCAEIALRSLFYTGRFLGGKWMRARV